MSNLPGKCEVALFGLSKTKNICLQYRQGMKLAGGGMDFGREKAAVVGHDGDVVLLVHLDEQGAVFSELSYAVNLDEVQFAVMWPASITCFQRADSSFMNWANCSGVSAIMS